MAEAGSDLYRHLLSPGRIGGLELRNRIVLTPMGTNLEAADGTPGERLSRFYQERARGGVGMVVVGVTGVAWPAGVSNPRNLGLSNDAFIAPFRALTERLHAHGAKVAVQLQHAGRVSLQDVAAGRPLWVPSLLPEAMGDLFAALTPAEIAAVTEPYRNGKLAYREMSTEDMAQVAEWFAAAAERARTAGFDAVEIHAGHGYLLSAFLSPSTNKRDDTYGGPLENRARLLLETIAAVRRRVGDDFPLWCRLDAVEYRKADGITAEDARRTAAMAVAAGLDAIHVSAYADPRSGIAFTDAPLPHRPCAYVELAAAIRREVATPVIVAGRISPRDAEKVIADARADFIAMGRALIADPELARKLAAGEAIRPCVYAYRCVGNVFVRKASECVVNPAAGHEAEFAGDAAKRRRRILVAGGGPAGMEAARLLAGRGHRVTLCERDGELGGMARLAAAVEPANGPLIEYLAAALQRGGVDVRLRAPVTKELVAELDPDDVVVATGARLERPALPGFDRAPVLDLNDLRGATDRLRRRGESFAVLGGDLIAAELGEWLVGAGAAVTLLYEGATLAPEMAPPRRWRALHALREGGAVLCPGARVRGVTPRGVDYVDAQDSPRSCAAAVVVLASGRIGDGALVTALSGGRAALHRLGDCDRPGYFEDAFLAARRLAQSLSA